VVDQRHGEAVALVHELLENRRALAQEHREPRQGSRGDDDGDRDSASHQRVAGAGADLSGTSAERYAVVSCHVERPLDDRVWERFAKVQRRRPGGFTVAALIRPPDPGFDEDEELWASRAREAQELGALGHHVHWLAPDKARPKAGDPAERVLAEGRRLRELGFEPTLFCGGGWYTDEGVVEACAELGYVDVTPRPRRPHYLAATERWAELAGPARVRLPSGRSLTALPTTHSLEELGRAILRRSLPSYVHVYFHDHDLLSRRGRLLPLLSLLARRATVTDLAADAAAAASAAPEVAWADVARP
jgi:hypothetical protein